MRRRSDVSLAARVAVLVGAGAGLGGALHALHPGGLTLASAAPPLMCSAAETPMTPPEDITAVEVRALCDSSRVLVADTRPAAQFAAGHVAGAIHVPCQPGALSPPARAALDQAETVVVVGETGATAREAVTSLRPYAPRAAWKLLAGEFSAWEAAGLACASGPCHECMATSASGHAP